METLLAAHSSPDHLAAALDLSMLLRTEDQEISALLKRFEGTALHFVTRSWLAAGETFEAWIEGPGGQQVRARLLVRDVSLGDDLTSRCAALVTELTPTDSALLTHWVEAALGLDTAPPADPQLVASDRGRALQVSWRSTQTFLENWDDGLAQGLLPLPGVEALAGRVALTLVLPGGQRLSLSSVRIARRETLLADLRVQDGARRILTRIAHSLRPQ